MVNKVFLFFLVALISLASNAEGGKKPTSKKAKYETTAEYFATLKNDQLCLKAGKIYRNTKNQESDVFKNMETEINKRGLIKQEHLKWVFDKTLNLGANECVIYAALGLPDGINRSVSAGSIHKQYVYGRTYIYTEDGIVTSWQD